MPMPGGVKFGVAITPAVIFLLNRIQWLAGDGINQSIVVLIAIVCENGYNYKHRSEVSSHEQ